MVTENKQVRTEMERVEKSIEEITLDVLNHFMKKRDEIHKALDNDPHGGPNTQKASGSLLKAIACKADKN